MCAHTQGAKIHSMDARAKEEFRAKWRADLDTYYAERHRQLDLEYQKDLERIDEIWSRNIDGEESSPAKAVMQEAPTKLQKSTPTTANGLPNGLTRREVVLEILPEFRDRTFTQPDIKQRFLEKYPGADSPHFGPSLSTLLRQMAERDEIARVKKARRPTDPHVYKVKERTQEEESLEF